MPVPFFSIIVTVYNRPSEILRCVDSCLSQSFTDFELILVDDGSTDETALVLDQLGDKRIKVIHHSTNQGIGAARNTGDDAARGEWFIRIDSDHSLLPGALDSLHKICLELPDRIAVIGARYQWESGVVTPRILPAGDLDYIGRIRWAEEEGGYDNLSCTRRTVFDKVRWVESMEPSALFQLDQAKLFWTRIISDILAMEYTPSISILRSPTLQRWESRCQRAPAQADYYARMLNDHGAALYTYGPFQYRRACMWAAFYSFLAGRRRIGVGYIINYLHLAPFSFSGWSLLLAGLMGSRMMKMGYLLRDRLGLIVKDNEI
jgi:glycosyltransferase involved in cell wall biosynthesis